MSSEPQVSARSPRRTEPQVGEPTTVSPVQSDQAKRATLQVVPGPDTAVADEQPVTRPQILAVTDADAIRQLRSALGEQKLPNVYVSDGSPVHIERVSGTAAHLVDEDAPLPVRASQLTGPLLTLLLAEHAELTMQRPSGAASEWAPPTKVTAAVLSSAEWPGLQPLAGIVGMPVIRRDGTLLQAPGYDPTSHLYLSPSVDVDPIDGALTPGQVEESKAFVFDTLLRDFEWDSPADRANYIGLLVTPFLRRHLRCMTPLGIVTATMPGSGKSILAGLIGLLVGQKTLSWADDDRELEKVITSAFTVEAGVVVFDNLEEGAAINSPILANLLTNQTWSGRILGASRIRSWPNERLWLATGNNLRVGGDIASRSVLVRLSPRAPHPEERTGFLIPNLDEWLTNPANRAATIRHLLVLILDWTRAGSRRDTTLPNMRQFTSWAHGVGGFLEHHGVKRFLANLEELRATDDDDVRWAVFLAKWQSKFGARHVRAAEVFADGALDTADRFQFDPWDGAFITSARGGRPRSVVQLAATRGSQRIPRRPGQDRGQLGQAGRRVGTREAVPAGRPVGGLESRLRRSPPGLEGSPYRLASH